MPTAGVLSARRFAARVRIAVALIGGLILIVDPEMVSHPVPAAFGLGVIGLTGLIELLVDHERWLGWEETFSCSAGILIVAWSGGEINAITLLWLIAAATGVLARGGRVGSTGRILVVGALIAPILIEGPSPERTGLAVSSILLLLAVGRISREAADLLAAAEYRAGHDELTGLLSRSAFCARVGELAAGATHDLPAALIVIDIDGFGAINKRHGNAGGDALLGRIGDALRDEVDSTTALGRIGGDDLVAFAFTDQPDALAERLVATVAEAGAPLEVTARAGYSLCPHDGSTADALTTAAEVALRVAKRGGGGPRALPYQGARVADSADGARATLERLCAGEGLETVVQPIVDVETWVPHAYEALARFSVGGGGPLQWFALAEEFGMRTELELACLDKALDLLPDLPAEAQLSVNLSGPLLVDPRAVDMLGSKSDISRLIVEVTEDALVREGAGVERATAALRDRGVQFAVDDIGAGYAGLGQLAAIRPSYLKLDRALVQGIDGDPGLASLMRLLADYGRSMDGVVVAEGVETVAELDVVIAAGVTLVQGFLLARPGRPWPGIPAPGELETVTPFSPASG